MRLIAPVTVTALLAAIVLGGACSLAADPPAGSADVEAGKRAFVAFDFHRAKEIFGAVLGEHPEHPDAAYGYARTLITLNDYEEALPAFERALELAPDDPRVHEGYLYTLVWGGKLRGRRAWLDRAIEAGGEAIRRFPDSVESYDLVEDAVGELNQPEMWLQMLDTLEPELGSSPVFRIHRTSARLAQARSADDRVRVAAIEEELREDLVGAAAADAEAVEVGAPADAGRRYLLAIGHMLLDDKEEERSWLARLDETAEGRRMGSERTHFDVHYVDFNSAREAPLEERLEIIERWKRRFEPAWETADTITTYRVPLGQELVVLVEEAHRQREEDGEPSDELIDQIVAIGRNLARLDTWGGAGYYRYVSLTLIDLETRLDEALRFADEGITALEERRAGLLYPGLRDDELERARENSIASFEHLRGRAFDGIGRLEDAEDALRRAIEISPRSDRFASLGELLTEEGRYEEAYETLITALAHNAEDERIQGIADRIREATLAAAEQSGRDGGELDRDLENARAEVIAEARRRMVADRLDREAPDFELIDTEGKAWRLLELRGKVVLLNFWATWCGSCRTEFPYYSELVDAYAEADDVVFLAITTDTDHSVARGFLDENDYRFTVLFNEGTNTDYQVVGIPTHFILGPGGRIRYATTGFPGPERYAQEMRLRIEALRSR